MSNEPEKGKVNPVSKIFDKFNKHRNFHGDSNDAICLLVEVSQSYGPQKYLLSMFNEA